MCATGSAACVHHRGHNSPPLPSAQLPRPLLRTNMRVCRLSQRYNTHTFTSLLLLIYAMRAACPAHWPLEEFTYTSHVTSSHVRHLLHKSPTAVMSDRESYQDLWDMTTQTFRKMLVPSSAGSSSHSSSPRNASGSRFHRNVVSSRPAPTPDTRH